MWADVWLGDCRVQMSRLADGSIDSIVTDPPYELGFMGKSWDATGIAYDIKVWQECLRVLKPGGLLWMSVPHFQSENSFTDPTHVRHCTLRTWDYWCEGTALGASHGPAYGGVKFTKRRVEWVGDDIQVELIK